MPRPKSNRDIEAMRRMIHQHLQGSALVAPPVLMDAHLDEDALNAFVEGRLGETEARPVVKHLVACSYCRHATSQLVRLEAETGP
ncbi:MAG TPA: zf-HC2 domain-containing protein, partial [Pyrinomonadaceae bacterium]|nr:zf-HC2 domain-containing protein [Pyrinomonadaceae bacterium]